MRPWLTNDSNCHDGDITRCAWEELAAFESWLLGRMSNDDARDSYEYELNANAQISIYTTCCELADTIDRLRAELNQLAKHHAIVEHEVVRLRKEVADAH